MSQYQAKIINGTASNKTYSMPELYDWRTSFPRIKAIKFGEFGANTLVRHLVKAVLISQSGIMQFCNETIS
jgi:hypothetical protein